MLTSLTKEELIELIKNEFADVTREGGVSWHEAGVLDGYRYTQKDLDIARAKDTDKNWMEVAGDPNWYVNSWISVWSFLDSIGYQYYIVAAIARDLIFSDQVLDAGFFSRGIAPFEKYSRQRAVVAQYILYKAELPTRKALMAILDEADMTYDQYLQGDESWWTPEPVWSEWLEPLSDWRQFLPPNPPAKFDTKL